MSSEVSTSQAGVHSTGGHENLVFAFLFREWDWAKTLKVDGREKIKHHVNIVGGYSLAKSRMVRISEVNRPSTFSGLWSESESALGTYTELVLSETPGERGPLTNIATTRTELQKRLGEIPLQHIEPLTTLRHWRNTVSTVYKFLHHLSHDLSQETENSKTDKNFEQADKKIGKGQIKERGDVCAILAPTIHCGLVGLELRASEDGTEIRTLFYAPPFSEFQTLERPLSLLPKKKRAEQQILEQIAPLREVETLEEFGKLVTENAGVLNETRPGLRQCNLYGASRLDQKTMFAALGSDAAVEFVELLGLPHPRHPIRPRRPPLSQTFRTFADPRPRRVPYRQRER